jgi:endoglucanase
MVYFWSKAVNLRTSLILSASILANQGCQASVPDRFNRGVSLTALVSTRASPAGLSYSPSSAFDSEQFKHIKASGVETVRLVVQPAPLLDGSAGSKTAAQLQVIAMVAALTNQGLQVVVDMHPWPPISTDYEMSLVCDRTKSNQYIQMIASFAKRLYDAGNANVALELLNEPKSCSKAGVSWPLLQKEIVKTIRIRTKFLTLVVEGTSGQTDSLLKLNASYYNKDPNILFSFHFYEPFIFTTPGYYKLSAPVTFPAPSALSASAAGVVMGNANSNVSGLLAIRSYIASGAGPAQINQRFSSIANWARVNNIAASRIYLGEFGVVFDNSWTDNPKLRQSELVWLRTVAQTANNFGFKWSFWHWPAKPGYDFDERTKLLRADVGSALGFIIK